MAKKYSVELVPAVVLVDSEGELLWRLDGYVPAADYLAWLGTAEGLARHPAALRGTSRDAAEYRAVGDVFARAGIHDRAVGFFDRAAELATKPRVRGEALAAKGVSHYLNRGGTDELDKIAAAVLGLDPEGRLELRDNGLLLKALSDATKGRWTEAMSAVDEALRLAPKGDARDGLLYLHAYYVWKGEGKPDEARRIYEEILEKHPESLFRRAVEESLKGLQ